MKVIDLRSDTVTKPTPAMLKAMAEAELGDDVYGEDPTVNQLEALTADMTHTEAALFVTSGTQGNLVAVMSHCERGDEYIVGQYAHTYRWEGGGAAVLGSIQPQPLDFEADGSLDLEKVAAVIKPDNYHFARSRLLCLENTNSGRMLSLDYQQQASAFAKKHGLGLHLDGARVFNAAIKSSVPVADITSCFDTVSICLSKGLGAPVGSMVCGPRDLIQKARRWRKVVGGGMRQAGILAAAGIFALQHHVERLAEDHANAEFFAAQLSQIDELHIDPDWVQTNMVFASLEQHHLAPLEAFLKDQGILILARNPIRLVTHLDVTRQDLARVVDTIKTFFTRS